MSRIFVDKEKFETIKREDFAPDTFVESADELLPKRATTGSAGYDIVLPYDTMVGPNDVLKVETFVKLDIPSNMYVALHIRSSLGINQEIELATGVSVIDADFKDSIKVPLISKRGMKTLNKGTRIAQIVLHKYETFDNEEVPTEIRNGGIGSTGV